MTELCYVLWNALLIPSLKENLCKYYVFTREIVTSVFCELIASYLELGNS